MRVVPRLPSPAANGDDKIDLVCSSGHRTSHSLARVTRLDDGWCGKCGADISYKPLADIDSSSADDPAALPGRELTSVDAKA